MRAFAFKAVAHIFAWKIQAIQWISGNLLKMVGSIGHALMWIIDKKRLDVYAQMADETAQNDLTMQSIELKLLSSASQVRDHAGTSDGWTEQHTDALNAIGDALVSEMGWEEEAVHQYLKGVVESIDGLEYDS